MTETSGASLKYAMKQLSEFFEGENISIKIKYLEKGYDYDVLRFVATEAAIDGKTFVGTCSLAVDHSHGLLICTQPKYAIVRHTF